MESAHLVMEHPTQGHGFDSGQVQVPETQFRKCNNVEHNAKLTDLNRLYFLSE